MRPNVSHGAKQPATPLSSSVAEVSLVPPASEIWTSLIPKSLTVSPDGEAVAFAVGLTDGHAACLARGGALTPSARYDGVGQGLVFSPDGKRFSFVGVRGSRHHVVVDGTEGPGFDGIATCTPVFSKDGRRCAYVGLRDLKQLAVVDGVAHTPYDGIVDGSPTFSPDGRHFAYCARLGKTAFVVLDGKPLDSSWNGLGTLAFSADGGLLAHAAWQTRRRWLGAAKAEWSVVVNGKGGPAFDGIGRGYPLLSPVGARVAYVAIAGAAQLVVVDEREQPRFDAILVGPRFSRDGRRVLYVAKVRGRHALVVDGDTVRAHDGMGEPVFSPDGMRVAYAAKDDGRWYVFVDDRALGPFHNLDTGSLTFSPDSRRLAFRVVTPEGETMRLADEDLPCAVYDGVDWPVFSPDSRRVAWGARGSSEGFLVVDGRESSHRYHMACPNGSPARFVSADTVQFLAVSKQLGYTLVRERLLD